MTDRIQKLFEPVRIGELAIKNRIAMAPMTRCFSPNGVPGADVADYYRLRAEGGVGLIITEGTWIPTESASNEANAPRFYGDDALAGWKRVVRDVHAAGGLIFPQLWHVGLFEKPLIEGVYDKAERPAVLFGPSGLVARADGSLEQIAPPASESEIADVIAAYAEAAANAQALGFDGVEIHGAHGYLIDQFFWSRTNLRKDRYGGDIVGRTRFAVEVIQAIREKVGPEFPVTIRISQWKQQDYAARLVDSPAELEVFLAPMIDAGIDAFHCSLRRFWEGEFGTDRSFAGWVRDLSGLPVITVGSVTLQNEVMASLSGEIGKTAGIEPLLDRLEQGEFDMVAVGRALISNPDWAAKVERGAADELGEFDPALLATLI